MLLLEEIDLKYKNTALDENLTIVSCSLNLSHWIISHWTSRIWDPDFSCDHGFSFVAAGMDAFSTYWKKIQNELAPAPLSISVPLMTGKVCLSIQSKYCNQRHKFFTHFTHKGWRLIHIIAYTLYNNRKKIYRKKMNYFIYWIDNCTKW